MIGLKHVNRKIVVLVLGVLLFTVVTPVMAQKINLTVWRPAFHTDPIEEEMFLSEFNQCFERKYPEVKVTMVPMPWADLFPKYTAAVDSGTTGDLALAGADHMLAFVPSGAVISVDDVLEELGGVENFYATLKYVQWQGKTWGIPAMEGCRILYYNKAHFADAGLDPESPPANWEELVRYAKMLTRDTNDDGALDQFGFGALYSRDYYPSQYTLLFMAQAGGGMVKNGKVILDSEENAVGLRFYADLYLKHKICPPDSLIGREFDFFKHFTKGHTSMAIFGNGWAHSLQRQLPPERYEQFGYAPLPEGPGRRATFDTNDPIFIWNTCKNVEMAKEWIKFWLQEDNFKKWNEMAGTMSPLKSINERWREEGLYQDKPYALAALEQFPYGIRWGHPDGAHPANGVVEATFVFADMTQEIVLKNRPVEEVLSEYQKKLEDIYYQY